MLGFSMPFASAYRLTDRWLLHPLRRTSAGLLVATEPFVSLPLAIEPGALGDAVFNALTHSDGEVPHPKDWKRHRAPRLVAAGVRSENAFQLGSLLVSIERSPQGYRLEPTRNGGTKGSERGFHPLVDRQVRVPLGEEHKTLGSALENAVLECTKVT